MTTLRWQTVLSWLFCCVARWCSGVGVVDLAVYNQRAVWKCQYV